MRFWISKNSEVPVREQLATQVLLAVASGELSAGSRLPSTREIARRYGLHANTVAASYQSLVDGGTLEFRSGSGYFVRSYGDGEPKPENTFFAIADALIKAGRSGGMSDDEILSSVSERLQAAKRKRFLVIESDPALRDIIVLEIRSRFSDGLVAAVTLEELASEHQQDGAVLTAMFDERPKLEPLLEPGRQRIYLKGSSVAAALFGQSRPAQSDTFAIISAWKDFLSIARVVLLAAKVEPGAIITRSTADDGWQAAARSATHVICDSYTALSIDRPDLRVFPLVAEESLQELAGASK